MYTTPAPRALATVSLEAWRRGDQDQRAAISRTLDSAGADPGLFMLVDTLVPQSLIEEVVAATRAFFALPDDQKRALEDPQDQFVGYRGPDGNRNEYGSIDLKEMFHVGPKYAPTLVPFTLGAPADVVVDAALPGAQWPSQPTDFVMSWHRYYQAMQVLTLDLMDLFAATLGVPGPELAALAMGNSSDLAANFYPVADEADAQRIRNAAHADNTVFTVLYQDGDDAGLLAEWSDGTWTPVPAGGHGFVVNFGMICETLTARHWRAAPHQVAPLQEVGGQSERARVTIPFFFRPHPATILAPLQRFRPADFESVPMEKWMADWKAATPAPLER